MRKIAFWVAISAMSLTAIEAIGADYPEKPVSFVVPFPPGDIEDVLTRMIAEDFQTKYGVTTAVVNKPGGGGGPFPGALEVAAAAPDGYTVGSFVIDVPVVGPDIDIEGLDTDTFEPIGIFATYPFVIVARKDAPYGTMQELAAYAMDNDVALGHFGNFLIPTGVTFALAQELGFEFATEAAFDFLDCNTLASGDADVINTTIQTVRPCLDEVTVLASVTDERLSLAPDVPTVSELEPTLSIALWNGLFVPEGTPSEIKDAIAAVAKDAMLGDRAQKFAEEIGAQVYWKDAASSTAQIEADRRTMVGINQTLGE